MKDKHVFGGNNYVISSFGVARNPIFKDLEDLDFFKMNVDKYLADICEVFAYGHSENQFQYLIRIKERKELEQFYLKKQSLNIKNVGHEIYSKESAVIPDSYLIFSQEVSNMLNSYARRFNNKHQRKGSLFGDRYSKILVKNEAEMEEWVDRLNRMEELVFFKEGWTIAKKEMLIKENESGRWSSDCYYRGLGFDGSSLSSFVLYSKKKLRGTFKILPPYSAKSPEIRFLYYQFIKIFGHPPPW
jgi:hypothetical protein